MKFLVDQDVYVRTIRLLQDLGHDVVQVGQLGLSRAHDADVLNVAQLNGRILITRDRDFGGLVFAGAAGSGVIFLRMLPSTQGVVHSELERLLSEHSEQELLAAFVVVEPGRHRIRKIGPGG
jgi:predicted nuclease of predicted toxin-antitoxin system